MRYQHELFTAQLDKLQNEAGQYLQDIMPDLKPGQRLTFTEPVQPDDNDDRYLITGIEPDTEYGYMAMTEDDGYTDTCPVINYKIQPVIYLIERIESKAYTIKL